MRQIFESYVSNIGGSWKKLGKNVIFFNLGVAFWLCLCYIIYVIEFRAGEYIFIQKIKCSEVDFFYWAVLTHVLIFE